MQAQIDFITELAAQYKTYVEQPEELFSALNRLSESAIKSIYEAYADERYFQPVNFLRAELARRRLNGSEITKDLVEDLKGKIRLKEVGHFSHLAEEFQIQLQN